jgi:uncharacterized repeat protein (TIGR03803 family)
MKNEKIVVASKTAHSQRLKSFRTCAALILTTLMLVVAASTGATGQTTFTSLVSFDDPDSNPNAGLVQTTSGNLYGTTRMGGTNGWGTVFEITPGGKLTTLYNFCVESGCPTGALPNGGLVQATNGYLYGTTFQYGGGDKFGTVFKITLGGKLTTLHSFAGEPTDGAEPDAGLVQATNGDLYGTTYAGGTTVEGGTIGGGTVFKITPGGTPTTLHSFCSQSDECPDGAEPDAGLVQAANGNLYGTTSQGGLYGTGPGTVFQITPSGTLTTLYRFCDISGCGAHPQAALVQGTNGNLYGTTEQGGAHGYGTVFQITPSGKLTTIYSFCAVLSGKGVCTDGEDVTASPTGSLIQATDGNLYGTTVGGGTDNDGTVFELSPQPALGCPSGSNTGSGWCETVLHSFDGTHGGFPHGLVQDTNGSFYGTTSVGGTSDYGTVFSLSAGLGAFVEPQTTSGKEGAKIGILGQGFSSSSVVAFGDTQATTIKLTGTTFITATVPAGALTGSVTVTTGTTTLTSPQTFKVTPTISSFAPPDDPVGTPVTITGTGLEQTTKVTFDGKSATFTVISDTEVTADVPADAVTGKITVTTKGGSATSATSFTVN